MKRETLGVGETYHIFTKSIAGFVVFNDDAEYTRIMDEFRYFQQDRPGLKFSIFSKSLKEMKAQFRSTPLDDEKKLVDIVGYCIMPTHVHLILKQLKEDGISIFAGNVLNSYTRYFNTKHKRKGPLWEGRFKSVLVETDDQLLHLTRYVHLNPVTAYLIDHPEDWLFSSYREYLGEVAPVSRICDYSDLLSIQPKAYRKFVEDRIAYQRELAKIKDLLLE